MSRQSSLTINYVPHSLPAVAILSILLQNDWTLNDYGVATYLPLGEDDLSAWETMDPIDEATILHVIQVKESKGEVPGIVIVWQESDIGCTLLFHQSGILSFSLNINRKVNSKAHSLTDVGWYVERIIPPLVSGGFQITSIVWEEFL